MQTLNPQALYGVEESVENATEMIGDSIDDQVIVDHSDLRKYRIELPNLCDDSDLDPYEFRLLAHYKRVGRCTEGTRTTAKKCKMSAAQVSEKRAGLRDKGWIGMEEVALKAGGYSYIIEVQDRWLENFQKYSPRSPGVRAHSPHEHPVHSVKQRSNHIKKEPSSLDAARIHQSFDLFVSKFDKFITDEEMNRWLAFLEENSDAKVLEIMDWAVKKEIHMTNRAALMDSLETAAANWSGHKPRGRKINKVAITQKSLMEALDGNS